MYMRYNKALCLPFSKETGELIEENQTYKLLGNDYYIVLCLLKNDIKITEIFYPKIQAHSKKSLSEKVKLYRGAEKEKIKYIILEKSILDPAQNHIIIFREKNKKEAFIYKYLFDNYNAKGLFDPINYASHYLSGYQENQIRARFIFKYISRQYPEELTPEFNKIEKQNISQKDKYLKKYHAIKRFDDFIDFNKRYDKMRSEGIKLIDSIKKKVKPIKYFDFKFDEKKALGDHPLYNKKNDG